MGLFYDKAIRKVQPGPYMWPQATSGPKPVVGDLLPGPRPPDARRRNSLLPEAVTPRACVIVTQTRQERFDQALMQAARGVARCLTIACQGLQEQRKEPFSEASLVAAYTLGRHFANSMRVPVQDSSELLMRCSPFSPEVPDSHPGRLHAAVRVVDNAWRDDGGLEMLQQLVEEMEEAGVRPAYTQRLSPIGHPRGDPNDSTSCAIAQGHEAAVLVARDPPSNESVNPTSSSLAQGRGPPAGAQSVDSHGGVFSPPDPPTGGVTDSLACIATQEHGTLDRVPQVCPTGESPRIASIADPTGVVTPQLPAPLAVVDSACLTPAVSDEGVASSLEESPIPLAKKPKEPAAVGCSPCSTGTVATVKACSQSSSDSDSTPVEYPSSLDYAMAQSLHAISSYVPLHDASLRAKAIAVYREMCGLSIQESALFGNRDLEKDTWNGRLQGGMPEHFASLAKHVDGSAVLLRSNRFSIVTSAFGMDSELTSATFWVPRRDVPLHVRGCGDIGEQCHRATVVVIAEAERDGVKGGGHFRGAVFDHSLQVAPFCRLHGTMSMLPWKRGPVWGVRAWHLHLRVGGMKGHANARDCRRTRLVQQTRNYKPLATLVNRIAREMLREWFTWTTVQLCCNVLTKSHQHMHDTSPWSAVFSTGQHTRGHLWVEVGGVCNGPGGRRCSMQCLDGVTRDGAMYDVCQQQVLVCTGAWHGTCSWHGERRSVVLYSRGDGRTLPPWDGAFLNEAAFRLHAGA